MLLCYFAQKLCIKTNVVDRKLHLEMCVTLSSSQVKTPFGENLQILVERAEDGHVCQNSNVSERN